MGTGTPGTSAQAASPWAGSNPRCCSKAKTSPKMSSERDTTDGQSLQKREKRADAGKTAGFPGETPNSLSPGRLGPCAGARPGLRPQPRTTGIPSARAPRRSPSCPQPRRRPGAPARSPDTHSRSRSAKTATSAPGAGLETRAPRRALPGPV